MGSGCGGACGGAISTVLQNVNLSGISFWDILQEAPIIWTSYNSGWWWTNYPGAGGQGSRGGFSGDRWARNGNMGGPGAAVIIIEFASTM